MDKKWYVVTTYSGHEESVKEKLLMRTESMGMQDNIFRVIVPETTEIEIKDGVKKEKKKKMFPSYVLVEMVMSDEAWYIVRNTRGVTGFVGPGSMPVPLTPAEIKSLGIELPESILESSDESDGVRVQFDGKVGDQVMILSGAWENTVGEITDINESKQCLTINVEMFGRETPVEIGFTDVRLM